MKEFFELFERAIKQQRMLVLEVGWTTVTDYCLSIYLRNHIGTLGKAIIRIQEHSYQLSFAKAYVELENWLNETFGGY
jgi:hypothetical protein